jgi:hypothetical protein
MDEHILLTAAGFAAAGIAAIAWAFDYRRLHRRNLDAVGFMPWTNVFFAAMLTACVLLGLAAREWLAG